MFTPGQRNLCDIPSCGQKNTWIVIKILLQSLSFASSESLNVSEMSLVDKRLPNMGKSLSCIQTPASPYMCVYTYVHIYIHIHIHIVIIGSLN